MILKLISLKFLNFFVSTPSLGVSSIDLQKNIVTIQKNTSFISIRINNLQNTTISDSEKLIFSLKTL